MQAAIINFAKLDLPNKILWIGGMKQLGQASLIEHKNLFNLIKSYQWQDVILVGKEFESIHEDVYYFETSIEAATYIKSKKQPIKSSILIKGSRGSKMEVLLHANFMLNLSLNLDN